MRTPRILLLMALCALFAVAAGLAQTPQTVPLTTAEFLATLASPSDLPATELLPPAPKLLSTTCQTSADCRRGELCCYPCGVPDCNFICMKVNTCPLIP
ncbi:MAG TPA: hypothetical protein VLB76_06665 [Thermoanaerobaculia bacterium]|jgi:hypothetical protein|nr:hypothetical protein [Thermoanaerobaculia bacterium]